MVDAGTAAQLTRYGKLLAESPINVVSRRDRTRVWEAHIADSLAVAEALAFPRHARCLDLGSGGGLPGVVIAVLRPDVAVVCLDATSKKMAFVAAAVDRLGLPNVTTVTSRAETAARELGHREAYDVVVSRAVGRLAVVAELGRAFARPGGTIAAVKGPTHEDELAELNRVQQRLGISAVDRRRLPGDRDTWLVLLHAGRHLPVAVPRPVGVPQHRPLVEVRP